jgi:hypothetical protein
MWLFQMESVTDVEGDVQMKSINMLRCFLPLFGRLRAPLILNDPTDSFHSCCLPIRKLKEPIQRLCYDVTVHFVSLTMQSVAQTIWR